MEERALCQEPAGPSFMEHLYFCARLGAYCAEAGEAVKLRVHADDDGDILLTFGRIDSVRHVLRRFDAEWRYLCLCESGGEFRRSFPPEEADVCFLKALLENAGILHVPGVCIIKKRCEAGKTDICIGFEK